jgi:hypothetical protein
MFSHISDKDRQNSARAGKPELQFVSPRHFRSGQFRCRCRN